MSTFRDEPAAGTGLATVTPDGTVLDTWYPAPVLGDAAADLPELEKLAGEDADRGVRTAVVRTAIASLAAPPADAHDVYLRLHLLSHRLVAPHEANLDGVFGLLANVVWTNHGPCAVPGFEDVRMRLRARGPVAVYGVDKFPRMVDYVLPAGVRIADADRVRLGAHLAPGTTVMHEGFCNYNAGTLGASMVEGRISAGVVLGDDCVVEAGLYVTAGTRVTLPSDEIVAARTLSGQPGLLFRRNSVTGTVEALPRTGRGIALNPVLHAN